MRALSSAQGWQIDDMTALRRWLSRGRICHEVRGIVNETAHESAWQELTSAQLDEPFCGFPEGVPQQSLKSQCFPPRESLFVFNGKEFRETLPETLPCVFWGVRACDLAALSVQDRFFAEDPHYQHRRRQLLVVGVDCLSPCAGGFCHLVDAGPFVRDQTADLLLHQVADPLSCQINNHWQLWALTEQGVQAMADAPWARLENTVWQQRLSREPAVQALFPDHSFIAEARRCIDAGTVPQALWEQMAVQCLACSGCVNLCPSCSCYATRDVSFAVANDASVSIRRERIWDACLYDGFQREASGHNPSPTPGARMQRYWFHKFSEQFVPAQGRIGCVGCGRCDRVCPGVIGASDVARRIVNAAL